MASEKEKFIQKEEVLNKDKSDKQLVNDYERESKFVPRSTIEARKSNIRRGCIEREIGKRVINGTFDVNLLKEFYE